MNPPPAAGVGADGLRAATLERVATRPPGPELDTIADVCTPAGVPARLYRPTSAPTATAVWLHGGGWVIGDLDTHDRACRRLAARSGVIVLAVDDRALPNTRGRPSPTTPSTGVGGRLTVPSTAITAHVRNGASTS
ncbi:MAG: alpha/beta hydrolase fold domain-containing protein [Ilumatobacteraceae bacterium]